MAATVGVILAGGRASRMGNVDKPLLPLAGKPIIQHVIDLAHLQVDDMTISVNRNLDAFRALGLPLILDQPANCEGPLLGIYSAMCWFHEQGTEADYLACFPGDVPAFPPDLVSQLTESLEQTADTGTSSQARNRTVAWCQTGDQMQPLFSLWPFAILRDLEKAIEGRIHGPRLFFRNHPNVTLKLPAPSPPLFSNINTPEQLAEAQQQLEHKRRKN
ncbi:MAG: molybdenum cofactor guanylyltransferase [Gammaproteobacteria bacterium]|nr:molybdenum cofactor guanylyltransferase [Gammaproteobacteria bacterium]